MCISSVIRVRNKEQKKTNSKTKRTGYNTDMTLSEISQFQKDKH